jgi:hypothetical protein
MKPGVQRSLGSIGARLGDPLSLRLGGLVEVLPEWRFRSFDLLMVHLGNRHILRTICVFKEFAAKMLPTLFPDLPT